eukprot:2817086-Prymnesium_polylepis.1
MPQTRPAGAVGAGYRSMSDLIIGRRRNNCMQLTLQYSSKATRPCYARLRLRQAGRSRRAAQSRARGRAQS